MKNKSLLTVAVLAAGLFAASSCKKDDTKPESLTMTNGAFIINEGAWGSSNGSVSFYDYQKDSIINDVFVKVNNRPLGDVVQSMAYSNGKGYIVVNGSNKIEIINIADFTQTGTISDVPNPRYVVINDGKAFISAWGDEGGNGSVEVVDLLTNKIVKSIAVGSGPEKMIIAKGKLLVANSGGYSADSSVSVIDLSTLSVSKTIKVGDCPKGFVLDKNDNVWVMCSGSITYNTVDYSIESETSSLLQKISTDDFTVKSAITISKTFHPERFDISKDKSTLYYGAGFSAPGIYKVSITATNAPTTAFLQGDFYGFAVNPTSDEIYVFSAPSFTQSGKFTRYSSDGTKIKEYTVGIGPNGACF